MKHEMQKKVHFHRIKTSIIILLVIIISFLHYITYKDQFYYHIFYGELYFLPIILAGFWFGLLGALSTSIAITAFSFPLVLLQWHGFSPEDFDRIIEIVLYNGVAFVIGVLKNREIRYLERLLKTESLAAMGKSLAAVAHDMKTPLIVIGGFARRLRKKFNDDDHDRGKLEIVIRETGRLENMMQNMLEFSQPLQLHLTYENFNEIVQLSLNIVTEAAQAKRIHIKNMLSSDLPPILMDAERMEQVLINLLMNAIHASPETETLGVNTSFDREHIFIDVVDHGCGIPVDQREKIFSPFFSTKKGGTGLGLPIAQIIVQAHGGSLEILDNVEKGMVFRIKLLRKRENQTKTKK